MSCKTSSVRSAAVDSDLDVARLALMAERWPRLVMGLIYHRTSTGSRMRFSDRDWLRAIYQDESDYIVIQKASQIGFTEMALCAMMDYARRGLAGLYILPTDTWRNTFVQNRIDGMMLASPYYREHAKKHPKDADSRALKDLFGSAWKFVGSQQLNQFYEFPADRLIIDEHDRCDGHNLIYAADRLGASTSPGILKFGNPTYTGIGINSAYVDSDRHTWLIKCPHCGEWQELTWEAHFVRQDESGQWLLRDGDRALDDIPSLRSGGRDARAQCPHCSKFFDRLERGEWVPQRLTPCQWRGYKASKLFGDVRDYPTALEMFVEWVQSEGDSTRRERFYNNFLGEPYKSEGNSFTLDTLQFCKQDYLMPSRSDRTYAGCDVGAKFHVHIEEFTDTVPRKVFVGAVRSWDDLHQLCARYNVHRGVIDREPEHHATQQFIHQHPGWYSCTYTGGNTTAEIERKPDHKKRRVVVDRTAGLDAALARWVQGAVQAPRNLESLDGGDFVRQMTAAVRRWDPIRERYIWDEGGLPDHHQHADHYAFQASQLFARGALIR